MLPIELYIGDMKVDLNDDSLILFNWQESDLSNPTIIKNGYSKTITLEGTDNNNEIFGHFWDLERMQEYGGATRTAYNPSYRVPFKLFYNGSVYEQGYVKLQKITTANKVHKYEIGLYGGLGTFLYNLDVDWETGNKKTLNDIVPVIPAPGIVPIWYGDDLFDLGTTSLFLDNMWCSDIKDNTNSIMAFTKQNAINYAPTYAGLPTNLDADKVLINFQDMPLMNSSGDCHTYNGYALGKLPAKLTMEEVKDIRPYLLTPILRVKAIFAGLIQQTKSKGKYDIILDPDFFNKKNPYFWDSWITLNQVSQAKGAVSGSSTEIITTASTPTITVRGNAKYISYPVPSSTAAAKIKAKLDLNSIVANASDHLFLSTGHITYPSLGAIAVSVYTSSNEYGSGVNTSAPVFWLTNTAYYGRSGREGYHDYTYTFFEGKNWFTPVNENSVAVLGQFDKDGNEYKWSNELECEFDVGPAGIYPSAQYIVFKIEYVSKEGAGDDGSFNLYSTPYYTHSTYSGNINDLGIDAQATLTTYANSNFISGTIVPRAKLLATSFSPADFLVAYCKQFGLYMYKDPAQDKIYIMTRNNFFKRDNIINLEDLIDTSKDVEVKPLYADSNYVSLTNDGYESANYKTYKENYGKEYGQKIVDTGYEFNADTKELLDSPLKNAIQTKEMSPYFFNKDQDGLEPYVFNGFSYQLYKNGVYSADTMTVEVPKKEITENFTPFGELYYDLFSRPQFEDATHKGTGTEGVLLFYNGLMNVEDKNYYISDDSPYMQFLNNNPCWLMTNSYYDVNGNTIARQLTKIPKFSRYYEGNHWMIYSHDFGSPRELYTNDMENNDEANIYHNCFKKYYEDLYDINTKVITCYVKGDNFNVESLRNIYWFRNGLWRLNGVFDYNPATPDTTKCEFIKIQDLDNLTNEDPTTDRWIKVTLNQYSIGQSGGTIIGTVRTSDNYGWDIEGIYYDPTTPLPRELVTVSPVSGSQSGTFTLSVPSNIRIDREVTIKVTSDYNGQNVSASTAFSQPGVEYNFSIAPSAHTYGTLAGDSTFNVTNPYYYDWSITSKPSWITVSPSTIINGQTGYTGDTAVTISAAKNITEVERNGTVILTESTFGHTYEMSVAQAGYEFSISPNSLDFTKNGQTKTVTINNPYGYSWIVQSKPDWITTAVTSSGNLSVTAAPNIVFERTGTLVIKDTDFNHTYNVSLSQESGYVFDIDPTYFYFLPDYELEDTLTIENPNHMAWTITNIPAWLTVSPTAGTGTSVSITAAENIGFERSGLSISVNETLCDQHYLFDVVQESGYYFELLPYTGLSYTSGTSRQIMTVACKGYNWQITSKPDWITASQTTGFGQTDVYLTAATNIGYERSGVVKVKNTDYNLEYTLNVTQESGYYFNVSPLSFSFASGQSTSTLVIDNPNGYNWTILDLPVWMAASATAGTASTNVTLTAYTNGWDERTDIFEVSEDSIASTAATITVTQAEGYTLEYTPDYFTFSCTSGNSTLTITNPDNYNLTISDNRNWISASPTAVTSSTGVTISVTDNGDTSDDRTATITITNNSRSKTHTINVLQGGYLFYVEPSESQTLEFASGGSTEFIMVHDGNNFNWEVISYPNWLTPNRTTGNSTTSVEFTAAANYGQARTSSIVVREKVYNRDYTVNVAQASGYKFEVSPTSFNFAGTGETKTFTITNPYGYSWQMLSPCGWLSFSPSTGNSNATVSVTAAANGWDARTCTFYVEETTYGGGAQMTANQASGYTLSYTPTAFTFNVTSGTGVITITNPDGYNLSITDDQNWITVSPTATTTSTAITVSVANNQSSTSDRTGTITITNNSRSKTHTISLRQAGYLFYIEPDSTQTLEFASGGSTEFIMVHDGNNLNWEVISYPSWLTPNVTTGNTTRSVDFTASSNAGAPQRTGTITVRDKTFNIDYTVNVKQLSGYKFEVSPASLSFVGAGESKTITITNPYGCNWSITSPAGWITASPTTGNSNATVTVTAGANGWDARTSTLYVEETTYGGGAEVALSQASGYTLSYSPTAFTFNAVGESKTLTISNPDRYNLNISSNQSWLTVSPTATTSTSTAITVTVTNNTATDRNATITITNNSRSRTHTIGAVQAGYMFRVEPSSLTFASGGSTEFIMIYDGNNFEWEVTSYPSWLTPNVTTGNTTRSVEFTAPTNAGRTGRTGTITVREKATGTDYTVNVSQDSGYAFSVSPTSVSFDATGGTATLTITNPYGYNWSITNYNGWVTASPTTGNSNATVTLTATANTSEYGRSGILYVEETTVGGGAEISMAQAGQTYLTPRILSITATEQDNPQPSTPNFTMQNTSSSYGLYGNFTTNPDVTLTGDWGANVSRNMNNPVPFNITAFTGGITKVSTSSPMPSNVTISINDSSYYNMSVNSGGYVSWTGSIPVAHGDNVKISFS